MHSNIDNAHLSCIVCIKKGGSHGKNDNLNTG